MIATWARFFRVQTLGATAMAPVLGAAVAIGLDIRLVWIFIWGALVHLFGFGFNNWCDREHDKLSKHHSNPIARGELDADEALRLISVVWLAQWLLPLLFLQTALYPVYGAMLSMNLFGTAYNMWSKKIRWSGFLLGGWSATLTLSGFIFFSTDINRIILILCVIAFMQCWCQWIEGLVKDAKTENNLWKIISVKMSFWAFVFLWISKAAQLFSLDAFADEFLNADPIIMGSAFAAMLLSIFIWYKISVESDRSRLLKLSGVHEIIIYAAPVLMLSAIIGWQGSVLFLLIPLLFYLEINRALYGHAGRPDV